MAELLLLLLVAGAAALAIAWPLLDGADARPPATDPEREARSVRHRLALEALRDVEADHRAGSLDDAGYAAQRAEAEEHAARTLAALESSALASAPAPAPATGVPPRGGRLPLVLGGVMAALLLTGYALPAPLGTAMRTETDRSLADAIAREEARRVEIAALLARLEDDPGDARALSDLADAYLAGGGADDRRRGAVALLALIGLEPQNASAYRRLITAYVSAGDWPDAAAATEAYAGVAGEDEPDISFFRGLIALRGDRDADEAVRHFDRFLELAPNDPRAPMIRGLRTEAAGDGPGG